jgi:hypothetical protein
MTIADDLTKLAEGITPPAPDDTPKSPARKEATGNIRNVGQMGDEKLARLFHEMQPYKDADPEAFGVVAAEAQSRRLT